MHHELRNTTGRRRGFTLIELLVVIAIIAILASLAAWAVFATIGNRRARNTEATIKTVNKVLQSHWRYVIDEADKDTPSPAVVAMASTLSGPDPARAKVIWRKVRLMEAFPQSYAEITAPYVYAANLIPSGQRRYITKYQNSIGGASGSAQSAACLLLALSVARGGNNALSPDQIAFAVADTDGDGVKELVDGWGNPIGFFRFPWNNPTLANSNPAGGKFADPIDKLGSLINNNWYYMPFPKANPNRVLFEANFHSVSTPGGTPNAWYTLPVIVSAGPDGVLGLNPDMSVAAPGADADNIYSFKLQLD